MKRLIPVAAAFLVLVVAMAMREAQRPHAGTSEAEQLLTPVSASAFGAQDVLEIEVAGPGGAPRFTLARRGEGDWIVDAPFRAPAAAGRADALARALSNAAGEFRTDDTATLPAFDLTDDRSVSLTARGRDGGTLARVLLGRSSGARGAFVRILGAGVPETTVYAVSSPLRSALGLGPTPAGAHDAAAPEAAHFHDATFPALDLQSATRVVRTTPRNRVAFVLAEGEWRPQGSGELPPKHGAVPTLLRGLANGLATRGLVDPDAARRAGLDAPTHVLDVVLADGGRRSIHGVATDAGLYVRLDAKLDPPVVYSVEPGAWGRAFPSGAALFELGRLQVRARSLGRYRIERRGAPTFDMTRKDGHERNNWVVAEPGWPLPARQQQLRGLPVTLGFVRPVDWMDGSAAELGLGRPELVVRYGRDTDAVGDLAALRVYGAAPGGNADRLAQFPGSERVVVLAQAVLDKVAPDLIELHRREILRGLDLGYVAGVEVARRSNGNAPWEPEYELALADEAWLVRAGGVEDPADRGGVEAWIGRLLALRADGIAVPGGAPSVVRITVRLHRGDPWELELTAPETDGRRVVRRADAAFETRGFGGVPAADSFRAR